MTTSVFMRTVFAAAPMAVAAIACAAEPAPGSAPEYRLEASQSAAFRLVVPDGIRARLNANDAPDRAAEVTATADLLSDRPFATQIENAARAASLDPALVHAVIFVESRYNAKARSPKGAVGIMQVLPETAARYGVRDPGRSLEDNLKVGTRYLSDLVRLFDGRLDLALAAYNAGENAVQRHGLRIPPYAETRAYVPAVLEKYREWREPPPAEGPPEPAVVQYLPGTRLELGDLRDAIKR